MFIATILKCITCVDPKVIFLLQSANTSQSCTCFQSQTTSYTYCEIIQGVPINISRTQFSVHISITLTTVRNNILQQSSVNLYSGKSGSKDQVALHYYYTSPSHWCKTHEVSKLKISQRLPHYQPAR